MQVQKQALLTYQCRSMSSLVSRFPCIFVVVVVLWFAFSIIYGSKRVVKAEKAWEYGTLVTWCGSEWPVESSTVNLAILWSLPHVWALIMKSGMLFECGTFPPYVSHPPDVIHVISVPRPSSFFTALLLPYSILKANWRIGGLGRPVDGARKKVGKNWWEPSCHIIVSFNSPVFHPRWSALLHAGVILDV